MALRLLRGNLKPPTLLIGIDMETLIVLILAVLAVACCVMFWLSVLRPAKRISRHEYLIADFRSDISRWEHEQND